RALAVLDRRLGAGHRRLRLYLAGDERGLLQLDQHLAGLHPGVIVGIELVDRAAYLAADLDLHHRAHRPGRGDHALDGPAIRPGRAILRRRARGPGFPPPEPERGHGQDGESDDPAIAVHATSWVRIERGGRRARPASPTDL